MEYICSLERNAAPDPGHLLRGSSPPRRVDPACPHLWFHPLLLLVFHRARRRPQAPLRKTSARVSPPGRARCRARTADSEPRQLQYSEDRHHTNVLSEGQRKVAHELGAK